MPSKPEAQRRPLSPFNWPLDHHVPLPGATAIEERVPFEEYTWAAQPELGFLASHDKAEDHGGIETVYLSRLWVETAPVHWPITGTNGTVQRLVIEDLEGIPFNHAEYIDHNHREKVLADVLFGRHAVPQLGDMGTWKQAYTLKAGDVVRTSARHDYEESRTVKGTERTYGKGGTMIAVTWDEPYLRAIDRALRENAWVAVETAPE